MMKQVFALVFLACLVGDAVGEDRPAASNSGAVASKRVVNGAAIASITNYRFLVALQMDGFAFCGASVITYKHALTAAHCFDHKPTLESLTIYGGSDDQYTGGKVFPVSKFVMHPEYNSTGTNYDAAIVFISTTFAGHQYIAPINLQNQEITLSPFKTNWCYIVGWGYTNGVTLDNPDKLQQIWMLVISQAQCGKQWGEELLTPEMICTQLPNVDICSGDSGGPLVCNGLLTGIVSWGTSDCTGDWPAVFAKVASTSIRSFIRKQTGV